MVSGGCHRAVIGDWAQRATWRHLLAAAFLHSSPPCAAFGLWSCLEERSIVSLMEGCRGCTEGWTCKHQHGSQTDEMVRSFTLTITALARSCLLSLSPVHGCISRHRPTNMYVHHLYHLVHTYVSSVELENEPWWCDSHPELQVIVQCLQCSRCGCVPVCAWMGEPSSRAQCWC